MKEALITKIEETIKSLEMELGVKLKFELPINTNEKVFAIAGHKNEMEKYSSKFLFLFEELEIKHNLEFWLYNDDNSDAILMHIYEYK